MHRRRYMKRKTALLTFFTNGPYSSEHKYWANFRVIVTGMPAAAGQAMATATAAPPRASRRSTHDSHHRGVYYDPYFYYYNPYFYGAGGYSPYCDDALAGQCYCPDDGGFGAGLAGVYCPAVDCQFIDCMPPDGLGDLVGAGGGADVLSGHEAAFGDLSSFMEESGGACGGGCGAGGDGGGGDGGGGDGGGGGCGGGGCGGD